MKFRWDHAQRASDAEGVEKIELIHNTRKATAQPVFWISRFSHLWNSLPTNIREAQSILTFKRHIKTHYFQSAFYNP